MRAVKIKGRRGAIGGGIVGYIRLDVHKAKKNKPNALNMNFPLQASRPFDFFDTISYGSYHMVCMVSFQLSESTQKGSKFPSRW